MSTYKPLSTDRTDVLRAKRAYGIWYGATLGFLFAFFTWGLDAYHLSQINSLHPWLKFAAGALLCTAAGGLTGWLAARQDKPILALLMWIVYGFFLAWLVVILPIVIFPCLLGLFEPEVRQYLHYVYYPEFATRIGVAFAWIIIFVAIAGLIAALLFFARAAAWDKLARGQDVLAHWTYSEAEWQTYAIADMDIDPLQIAGDLWKKINLHQGGNVSSHRDAIDERFYFDRSDLDGNITPLCPLRSEPSSVSTPTPDRGQIRRNKRSESEETVSTFW